MKLTHVVMLLCCVVHRPSPVLCVSGPGLPGGPVWNGRWFSGQQLDHAGTPCHSVSCLKNHARWLLPARSCVRSLHRSLSYALSLSVAADVCNHLVSTKFNPVPFAIGPHSTLHLQNLTASVAAAWTMFFKYVLRGFVACLGLSRASGFFWTVFGCWNPSYFHNIPVLFTVVGYCDGCF